MVFKSSESTAASQPESSHHCQLAWLSVSATVGSNLCPFLPTPSEPGNFDGFHRNPLFCPSRGSFSLPLDTNLPELSFFAPQRTAASLFDLPHFYSIPPTIGQPIHRFSLPLSLPLSPRLIDRALKKEKDKNLARLA